MVTPLLAVAALLSAAHADTPAPAVTWFDVASSSQVRIEGLPWFQALGRFRRLPLDPTGTEFSADVNALADNTAGAQIRFRTTSPFVQVRYGVPSNSFMAHMPATGQSGVDLYDETTGASRLCGVALIKPDATSFEGELCAWSADGASRAVTLNLPLYNGVVKFEIGLAEGSTVEPPRAHASPGRIVVYGTSITQGGVASRPGLGWTNQLSRKVDQEVVNLGFSGSGLGEPALARRITEIENTKLILLDYEANAQEGVRTTLKPFIEILRAHDPTVPIVVISQIPWIWEIRSPGYSSYRKALREFQSRTVAELRAAGDVNLYFIDGYSLMPLDHFEDGLVDGVHPNDLGHSWIAEGLSSQLTALGLVRQNR